MAETKQKSFDFSILQSVTSQDVDFGFLRPLKPSIVFSTYWRFAAERQNVFFKRIRGLPRPWTKDPIIEQHKFTNAYRASDRVSQYLIRNVIYGSTAISPNDVFFRTMLFKFFNKIETWELLERELGTISWESYTFERYDKVLNATFASGQRIYSAAYIMPSGGSKSGYSRKHQMHLRLLERMMNEEVPRRLVQCKSMKRAFELLRGFPTIGDFLAYQYVTDLNYSDLTTFDEMEFVIPGPGAKDGIRKCFLDTGTLTEAEVIRLITERQVECFAAVGVKFATLWGRSLQLIDCQNLFCEVDKYARVAHPEFSGISGRLRIKQKLQPSPKPLIPWYPPKWGLNNLISRPPKYVPDY